MTPLDLMDVNDLAETLKVSKDLVYTMVREKRVPFVRLGPKLLRFRQDEITHWILNNGAGQV